MAQQYQLTNSLTLPKKLRMDIKQVDLNICMGDVTASTVHRAMRWVNICTRLTALSIFLATVHVGLLIDGISSSKHRFKNIPLHTFLSSFDLASDASHPVS